MALGDSIAAGQGLAEDAGPYDTGTDWDTDHCYRHLDSYPRTYARNEQATRPALASMGHYACGGATTHNIYAAPEQNETFQLGHSDINTQTRLVTITIGANDAGFGDAIEQCIKTGCQRQAIDARVHSPEFAQSLYHALAQIKSATSPDTSILLIGYPPIFPQTLGEQTCQELAVLLTPSDQNFLNSEAYQLDGVEGTAAADAGVQYLQAMNSFSGHEICGSAGPWWRGLTCYEAPPSSFVGCPFTSHGPGSFHPTLAGHSSGYYPLVRDFINNYPPSKQTKWGFPQNPSPYCNFAICYTGHLKQWNL